MSQIACPQCLATNRVPEDKPAEKARCGACKASLFNGHPVEADETELRCPGQPYRYSGGGGFLGAVVRALPHDGAGLRTGSRPA